jgi:predicted transcriptional regulator
MSYEAPTSRPNPRRVLVIDINDPRQNAELVLKALASDKRIAILRFLGSNSSSVNEIAEALDLPASTATMHVNALEEAGLVLTALKPATRGLQKICARAHDQVLIVLPEGERTSENTVDISMPIGAYVDCRVRPTCGIASEHGIIGQFDDPDSFYDPERINAQLIWFKQGSVEYRFPNRMPHNAMLHSLQFSMEICSEAPLHNEVWPSDITLWVNDMEVGTWTSPGDLGGDRGTLTPSWWEEWNSQYGLLKMWKVTPKGSFVDGVQVSGVTLDDCRIGYGGFVSMRLGIKDNAANVGGMNIFGRQFGNYPQDIVMRMVFERRQRD